MGARSTKIFNEYTVDNSGAHYSAKISLVHSTTFTWTGFLDSALSAATVTLWVTDIEKPRENNDADWVEVTGTYTMPDLTTAKQALTFSDAGYRWARFKIASVTGTQTLNAYSTIGKNR